MDSSFNEDESVPAGSLISLNPRRTGLSPIQIEIIEIFIHLAHLAGMPRSLGEIYGFVFSSATPVSFDDVVAKLNISTGSASQGLRQLRSIGALKTAYVPGDRRDHYQPEIDLRKLVDGLAKAMIEDQLRNGNERLSRLEEWMLSFRESPRATIDFFEDRIAILRAWHSCAKDAFPMLFEILRPIESENRIRKLA